MTQKPTATYQALATDQSTDQFVRETSAQIRGFRQGLAIGQQRAALEDDHQVLGRWIHLGCGGELVRLQGIARPVCTTCAREVR
jgi:hypothetical protein